MADKTLLRVSKHPHSRIEYRYILNPKSSIVAIRYTLSVSCEFSDPVSNHLRIVLEQFKRYVPSAK